MYALSSESRLCEEGCEKAGTECKKGGSLSLLTSLESLSGKAL